MDCSQRTRQTARDDDGKLGGRTRFGYAALLEGADSSGESDAASEEGGLADEQVPLPEVEWPIVFDTAAKVGFWTMALPLCIQGVWTWALLSGRQTSSLASKFGFEVPVSISYLPVGFVMAPSIFFVLRFRAEPPQWQGGESQFDGTDAGQVRAHASDRVLELLSGIAGGPRVGHSGRPRHSSRVRRLSEGLAGAMEHSSGSDSSDDQAGAGFGGGCFACAAGDGGACSNGKSSGVVVVARARPSESSSHAYWCDCHGAQGLLRICLEMTIIIACVGSSSYGYFVAASNNYMQCRRACQVVYGLNDTQAIRGDAIEGTATTDELDKADGFCRIVSGQVITAWEASNGCEGSSPTGPPKGLFAITVQPPEHLYEHCLGAGFLDPYKDSFTSLKGEWQLCERSWWLGPSEWQQRGWCGDPSDFAEFFNHVIHGFCDVALQEPRRSTITSTASKELGYLFAPFESQMRDNLGVESDVWMGPLFCGLLLAMHIGAHELAAELDNRMERAKKQFVRSALRMLDNEERDRFKRTDRAESLIIEVCEKLDEVHEEEVDLMIYGLGVVYAVGRVGLPAFRRWYANKDIFPLLFVHRIVFISSMSFLILCYSFMFVRFSRALRNHRLYSQKVRKFDRFWKFPNWQSRGLAFYTNPYGDMCKCARDETLLGLRIWIALRTYVQMGFLDERIAMEFNLYVLFALYAWSTFWATWHILTSVDDWKHPFKSPQDVQEFTATCNVLWMWDTVFILPMLAKCFLLGRRINVLFDNQLSDLDGLATHVVAVPEGDPESAKDMVQIGDDSFAPAVAAQRTRIRALASALRSTDQPNTFLGANIDDSMIHKAGVALVTFVGGNAYASLPALAASMGFGQE